MSYNITKTNGVTIGTIADGTYNDTATSLTLVGRNFSNYGQIMTNNLVSLVENFAYNISPSNPLAGQLWWDTGTSRLKVYTGSQFKIISSATAQATPPNTTIAGDIWWDTSEEQLYVYNGTSPFNEAGWILVGPPWKKTKGKSGAIWEQITDTLSSVHDVVSLYLNGTRTAIISRDSEFTPNVAITGFSTIKTGHNLASSQTLWGTANNASYLGDVPAANYLRSDSNDTTSGTLGVLNDDGLTVGVGSDLSLKVNGNDVEVRNQTNNGDINIFANVAGVDSAVISIDGATKATTFNGPITASGALSITANADITGSMTVSGTLDVTGNATAPTQAYGTADTTVATTEFVINNSGFLTNKIYGDGNGVNSTTFIEVNDTGTGNARVVIDNTTIATGSASGLNLSNGAEAVTQPDTYSGSGNTRIATTQFVKTATQWWDGSAKFVSTDEPNPGVNDVGSNDGDIWFQREA